MMMFLFFSRGLKQMEDYGQFADVVHMGWKKPYMNVTVANPQLMRSGLHPVGLARSRSK